MSPSGRSLDFRQAILAISLLFLTIRNESRGGFPSGWEIAGGTEGVFLADITIAKSNPDSMYLLGDSLLLSTDGGLHWETIAAGTNIGTLVADPRDPSRLYLNETGLPFDGNAVQLSTNGGILWTELFRGICHEEIGCSGPVLARDPLDDDVLFAVANPFYLVQTSDRGNSWDSILTLQYNGLWDVGISPADNNFIFAAYARPVRILKSSDRGSTWSDLSFPVAGIDANIALACDPSDPLLVYAALDGFGVYRSVDGGFTWNETNTGLTEDDLDAGSILINPADPGVLFLGLADETPFDGESGLVFVSLDRGESWVPLAEGLPASGHVSAMAIDPAGLRVFACVNSIVDTTDRSGLYVFELLSGAAGSGGERSPSAERLLQNYPNPFNGDTVIRFELPHNRFVSLKLYSLLGEELETLVEGDRPAGLHSVPLDASKLPSGIYFYSLRVGGTSFARKMILLR